MQTMYCWLTTLMMRCLQYRLHGLSLIEIYYIHFGNVVA
jgi:hypothetical protein